MVHEVVPIYLAPQKSKNVTTHLPVSMVVCGRYVVKVAYRALKSYKIYVYLEIQVDGAQLLAESFSPPRCLIDASSVRSDDPPKPSFLDRGTVVLSHRCPRRKLR